jgi:Cys-tRNA(Pro)/Cys-tRNA(Cys) deacylase
MPAQATPATRAAGAARIAFALHEYEHDPSADSYALEAAGALAVDPARVFKTLVVSSDRVLMCVSFPRRRPRTCARSASTRSSRPRSEPSG